MNRLRAIATRRFVIGVLLIGLFALSANMSTMIHVASAEQPICSPALSSKPELSGEHQAPLGHDPFLAAQPATSVAIVNGQASSGEEPWAELETHCCSFFCAFADLTLPAIFGIPDSIGEALFPVANERLQSSPFDALHRPPRPTVLI